MRLRKPEEYTDRGGRRAATIRGRVTPPRVSGTPSPSIPCGVSSDLTRPSLSRRCASFASRRVRVGTRGAVILEREENETERRRGRSSDESGEGNDGTRKRREQGALPDFSGRTREARTMTTRRRIGRAIAVGRGREAGGAGCGASGGAGRPARVPAVPNAPSRERPSKGRAQTAFKSLRAIVTRERRDAETCVL